MKPGKTQARGPVLRLEGTVSRSAAVVYEPPAGSPGGREQLTLVTKPISEGNWKTIEEARARCGVIGVPVISIPAISLGKVSGVAGRDGGNPQRSPQGDGSYHCHRAFEKHAHFSCYEAVVNPARLQRPAAASRVLAVRPGHRYKRGQLHNPLI
jgi:hypothetical protein